MLSKMENLVEIWKEIPNTDGAYSISNKGHVKGRKGIKAASSDRNGYKKVSVFIAGKGPKSLLVHRLVALAFVPNPNPSAWKEVNHIDGDKSNNAATNLEWCDRSHNIKHAFDMGLKANKKGSESPLAKEFYEFDLEGRYVTKWFSAVECSQKLGIPKSDIYQNLNGGKTSHGRIFTYERHPDVARDHTPGSPSFKPIIGVADDGSTVRYDYVNQCARDGFIPSVVCKCIRGQRLRHKGYAWRYGRPEDNEGTLVVRGRARRNPRVWQKDAKTGERIRLWDSAAEACRALGLRPALVSSVLSGARGSTGGFSFEHEPDGAEAE